MDHIADWITVGNILAGLVVLAIIWVVAYGLGRAWSLGYHRSKRNYVDQLVKDNCEKGNGHG